MSTALVGISGIVIVSCFAGAYVVARARRASGLSLQRRGDAVGVVFAFALLAFVEALLHQVTGHSFFFLLGTAPSVVAAVFLGGALLGMSYEYIWQFWLRWWYYPSVEKHQWLLALLPLFWGIFMFLMHDVYAILRAYDLSVFVAATLTAVLVGAIIEGINIWTRSWVYIGPGASLWILISGWVVFLGFVFVPLFNVLFVNPFGY